MSSPRPDALRGEALVLAGSAPLAPALAALSGTGWPGLVLSGTLAFVFLARHRRGPRAAVVGGLLLWAAVLSAGFIALTMADPARAEDVIPRAADYWDEMRPWLFTGEGKESTPSAFVPEHALHLALFALLAAATGGWGGLVLGAGLMAYMSFYVGKVALHASSPFIAALLAWHPWAVLRVVAFVMLGVSLSTILLERPGLAAWWRAERRAIAAALALWALDLVLKTLLAPVWPSVIALAF